MVVGRAEAYKKGAFVGYYNDRTFIISQKTLAKKIPHFKKAKRVESGGDILATSRGMEKKWLNQIDSKLTLLYENSFFDKGWQVFVIMRGGKRAFEPLLNGRPFLRIEFVSDSIDVVHVQAGGHLLPYKQPLILDDIYDSGKTAALACEAVRRMYKKVWPDQEFKITFATLLKREYRKDYDGFQIPLPKGVTLRYGARINTKKYIHFTWENYYEEPKRFSRKSSF